MTLSEFLQILNQHLGYLIDPDETTNRTRNALVVRGFLLNFVSSDAPENIEAQDYNPLNQSDDFLARIYAGTAPLPYKDANSILNRLDSNAFSEFLDSTLKAASWRASFLLISGLRKFFCAFSEALSIFAVSSFDTPA